MKKFANLMTILGILQVFFINQAVAQSCCASKSSCLKVTSMIETVKLEEAKPSCVDQAKAAQASLEVSTPVSSLAGPVGIYSASYLFSQFGALVSKMAGKIKSDDPCCIAKGCDPTACDVSKCEPAQCSTAKN
ncbi:MAG: hypothetical protein ABI761_16415 [Saprospiraceae bacterium]